MQEFQSRRKPGPAPGPPTRRYTVLLDEQLGVIMAEWAKHQPAVLSECLRWLLKDAYDSGPLMEPC